ncbi:MAG: hypothetical protein ACRC41_18515 [Sarcina sp.]
MSVILVVEILVIIGNFKLVKKIYYNFISAYSDDTAMIKNKANIDIYFKRYKILLVLRILIGIIAIVAGIIYKNVMITFLLGNGIIILPNYNILTRVNNRYVFLENKIVVCSKQQERNYDEIKYIKVVKLKKPSNNMVLEIFPKDLNKYSMYISIAKDRISSVTKILDSKGINTNNIIQELDRQGI